MVVVFDLSRCHNILLGLFNDSVNAVSPKFSFVRPSDIFACGWFDKRVAFKGVKHNVVAMALFLPTGH